MERLLSQLRDAAEAQDVADQFFVHDHRMSKRTALSKFRTCAEADYDFQAFYNGVGVRRRRPFEASAEWVADSTVPGPQWVKVSSENRLAWVQELPGLLKSLEGQAISVSPSHNWRWHHQPDARPLYIPVYEALICLQQKGPVFTSDKVLPALTGTVCAVNHPLGDRALFDWQKEQCGQILFSSYRWIPEGFEASFLDKASMAQAHELLFKDFETTTLKEGKGPNAQWWVTVKLPSLAEQVPTLSS